MLTTRILLKTTTTLALTLLIASCSNQDETLETEIIEKENILELASRSSTSPWSFHDAHEFSGDEFQVDNDGNGAHNWSDSKYTDDPEDNGFDIRDYVYLNGGDLMLQCPNNGIRAEFRDKENIDLDSAHMLDFTFTVENYDNNDELILAQLHNDGDAERPYLTISAENGVVKLKQSSDYKKGTSTVTSSSQIAYKTGDTYRIRIKSNATTKNVFMRMRNLDESSSSSNYQAKQTFVWDSSWNSQDGNFYFKFGTYMPDGGSNNTRMRVTRVSITGQ